MSSFKEESDEQNIIESYTYAASFLITLAIVCGIIIIKRLLQKVPYIDSNNSYSNCKCKECTQGKRYTYYKDKFYLAKYNRSFYIYIFLFIVSLLTFSFCCYKISSSPIKTFDPYEILNIPVGSSASAIKSSYKQLALKYHPDKSKFPDAKEKYIEITNAYKALTNEKARRNYELYGHPDGRRSFTFKMALPKFLLTGKVGWIFVISLSVAMFVLLPIWFIRWFNKSKLYNEKGMLIINQSIFYHFLQENTKAENLPFIIGMAHEYESLHINSQEEINEIKRITNEKYSKYFGYDDKEDISKGMKLNISDGNYKALYTLYSQCFGEEKIKYITDEEKVDIINKASLMSVNLIYIWFKFMTYKDMFEVVRENDPNANKEIKQFSLDTLNSIVLFHQCLFQKSNIMTPNDNCVMQIPASIKAKDLNELKNNISKLNEDQRKVLSSLPIYDIEQNIKEHKEDHDIDFSIKINRKLLNEQGNLVDSLPIGFSHSLTYYSAFQEKVLLLFVENNTNKIFDIEIHTLDENTPNNISYQYIKKKEGGEQNFTFFVYPLNYHGMNQSINYQTEPINKPIKHIKKEKVTSIFPMLDLLGESYNDYLPCMEYEDFPEQNEESDNTHEKQD